MRFLTFYLKGYLIILYRLLFVFCLTYSVINPTLCYATDLLTVYELALTNDAQIKTARAIQLAAIEALPQARALFFPVIAANSLSTYYNKVYQPGTLTISNITIPVTTTHYHYSQNVYGLTLNQPVFYYAQWLQLDKADIQVKQANANFAASEQDLILRTIQAYFNVLKAKDALKYAIALRRAYKDTLDQVEAQFKAGVLSNKADLAQTRARFATALSSEIQACNTLAIQKENLAQITCVPIEELASLKPNTPLTPPLPDNIDEWVCSALEQNLNLMAARFAADISKKDIKITSSQHLPTVNVNGAIIKSTASNDLLQTPANINSYIGIQMNIPIFSGGSVLSKTRQARHTFQQNFGQLESTYRQVETTTKQSFLNVITELNLIESNHEALVANQESLVSTKASYATGLKTIIDVLNAQSDLIQTEQNLSNARYDYIINRAELKQSAGILCPEEILLINEWLCE